QVSSVCMLSINTSVSGAICRICRVACNPLIPGRAQSITITCGFSDRASLTASSPSAASPTTLISGSSSSMRRKPRRTRLWSSTNRIEIFSSGMRLQSLPRDRQFHQRPTLRWPLEFNLPSEQLGPFSHRNQPNSLAGLNCRKPRTVVLNFELQVLRSKQQPDPGFLRARVANDVVQSFLQYAINVDRSVSIYGKRRTGFFVGYANSRLSFHHRQVPLNGLLESGFIKHNRMQCLREAADLVERALGNLTDFLQVSTQLRTVGRLIASAPQHG